MLTKLHWVQLFDWISFSWIKVSLTSWSLRILQIVVRTDPLEWVSPYLVWRLLFRNWTQICTLSLHFLCKLISVTCTWRIVFWKHRCHNHSTLEPRGSQRCLERKIWLTPFQQVYLTHLLPKMPLGSFSHCQQFRWGCWPMKDNRMAPHHTLSVLGKLLVKKALCVLLCSYRGH